MTCWLIGHADVFFADRDDGAPAMQLLVQTDGSMRCVYEEAIDLAVFGKLTIHRASLVEPDASGQWRVDLSPVGGPRLGPFSRRSEALATERRWLLEYWLCQARCSRRCGCL